MRAFTGSGGGYVEQAVARVEDVVALSARLSSVEAVTLGSAAPVAYFTLEHAHFAPGESVLVRGVAGSTGSRPSSSRRAPARAPLR